ncbi:tetratricopeptide repeat-containing glycosyltransferase [Streptomyces fructofermentans]|uniref:Glycosyl transferase n=1 Tax=Streptomyces fructofermentans TaxID=152141 RepID=A0A918NGT7_9ACTN|nr:glycosyltransferase [Streptomyces fructofermentans]GGX66515.1 glycosyl transferase [Streptomyces fructofermentans]
MKPRICLNMIVKDEAHVIARCLESVRPLIDTWVIVDTGSTDGTQDIIREVYSDIPGELHERPWKGFGESRTEAVELARDSALYLLFIDADDEMEIDAKFRMRKLTHDAYMVALHDGPLIHWRPALVSTRLPWRYVGVLHEYLECGTAHRREKIKGFNIRTLGGGARLKEHGKREKYLRDAAVLVEGLEKEPGNARYVFYLAQSWRDAEEPEKSIESYDLRGEMGGWGEEVYCSHLYAARLAEQLGHDVGVVMDRYIKAYESRPTRAEAPGELARLCRISGKWQMAYAFAETAVGIRRPDDILFVEQGWYTWRALDELSIAAYWTGRYDQSRELCEKLLRNKSLPEGERGRVEKNLHHARTKSGVSV